MKNNSFFKVVLLSLAAHFYTQVQAAEGLSLLNGQSDESHHKLTVENDTYFDLLLLREKAQDTLKMLLDMKNDGQITDRLEKAGAGLKTGEGRDAKENSSDLEKKLTLAGLQLAEYRARLDSFKVEHQKIEDTRKVQEAQNKQAILGEMVKPLVAVWTKKHTTVLIPR
jgi:hypothetical protein